MKLIINNYQTRFAFQFRRPLSAVPFQFPIHRKSNVANIYTFVIIERYILLCDRPMEIDESEFRIYSAKEQDYVYDFQTDSDAIDDDYEDDAVHENDSDGHEEEVRVSKNDSDDQEYDEIENHDNDYEHLKVDENEGHDSDGQNDENDESDEENEDENDERNSLRPGRLNRLLDEYLNNGGCCTKNCLIAYKDLATKRAYAMSHLSKATKKAMILGMLAMIHVWSDHGEHSQRSFNYCLDSSSRICRKAFCAVTGFKIKALKLLQKSFSESDVAPRMHGNSRKIPYNALSPFHKSIIGSFQA